MKKLLPLCFLLMTTGCSTARLVSSHGNSQSAFAPDNERDDRGGTVRINNPNNRESAYKTMHEFCNGPYDLTDEKMTQEPSGYGGAVPGLNVYGRPETQYYSSTSTHEVYFLSFKCKPQKSLVRLDTSTDPEEVCINHQCEAEQD